MTKKASPIANLAIWILCILLGITGIGLISYAFINLGQADVIVEWTTASELDTVGFNLLRGENADGPFVQVNTTLIPAASDTLTGSSYSFEDAQVTAGKTYFYMLEEVESSGGANQHGPIVVTANNSMLLVFVVGILLTISAVIYGIMLIRDQKQQVSHSNE